MRKVVIIDDTGRENRHMFRGHELRLAIDTVGHRMQNVVTRKVTFEGDHLDLTVKRAKRYMRSRRFRSGQPAPRHLTLAMSVFNKADREGFLAAVREARGAGA